jgi:LPXTG-site transpeptidase (sortase) family protein
MDEAKNTISTTPRISRLRLFNHGLTLIAIVLAVYVMTVPVLPELTWWVGQHTPISISANNASEVKQAADSPPDSSASNTLFIESLGMSEVIYEGGLEQLKKGVLRRSQTSTPTKGSNTVLVGHRFAYGSRGVFYHLDKVKTGDRIVLHWEGKSYAYNVSEVIVVPPSQVSIEQPTEEDILTLYTCTPLWTATDRLVIRATLVGENE